MTKQEGNTFWTIVKKINTSWIIVEELFILSTMGWGNKYFVAEGKENKYFVNKREVIITLLLDELCELKEGK